jgi:hypothetical protein
LVHPTRRPRPDSGARRRHGSRRFSRRPLLRQPLMAYFARLPVHANPVFFCLVQPRHAPWQQPQDTNGNWKHQRTQLIVVRGFPFLPGVEPGGVLLPASPPQLPRHIPGQTLRCRWPSLPYLRRGRACPGPTRKCRRILAVPTRGPVARELRRLASYLRPALSSRRARHGLQYNVLSFYLDVSGGYGKNFFYYQTP